MSFKINFLKEKVIATFGKGLKEGEITAAFIEIIDTIDIKNIKHIIFDCSKAMNYTFPKDYMKRVKILTLFSASWNSNINIIIVATNPQVKRMATDFINHDEDLKWNYFLFEDLDGALKWCSKNS